MEQLLPYFKALGDENRIKIVGLLLEREHCVCELMEQLNLSQSTVSHHVKILKRAGMLDERRSGTWNYYSLNKSGFAQVQSLFEDRLFMPVSKAVFRECPSFKKNC